jgi:signal transduction histidine kinase
MLSREHREEGEYRDALNVVGSQARSLGRLVQDMLVLARADAGGYPLRSVDVYLDELVADCQRAVAALAGERRVTVRVQPLAETPCRGDEDLLRQLVLNVVQNAVYHSPAGASVEIGLQRSAARVTLRVSNTGPGIPPADHERIFRRFVQLDPSRRSEGAGLGLPIARWIAEAHRGSLVLERSDAQLTTFCITLPAPA